MTHTLLAAYKRDTVPVIMHYKNKLRDANNEVLKVTNDADASLDDVGDTVRESIDGLVFLTTPRSRGSSLASLSGSLSPKSLSSPKETNLEDITE